MRSPCQVWQQVILLYVYFQITDLGSGITFNVLFSDTARGSIMRSLLRPPDPPPPDNTCRKNKTVKIQIRANKRSNIGVHMSRSSAELAVTRYSKKQISHVKWVNKHRVSAENTCNLYVR
jgi:hypothetical protein